MSAANYLGGCLGPTQACLQKPLGAAYDSVNNRLFVADSYDSRVMVWNTSSITNGMNASYVLGQTSWTGGTANQGGSAGQSTLSNPDGVAYDAVNSRLFVTDGNSRVLVFNVAPSYLSGGTGGTCSSGSYGNGENACYELGQSSGVNAFTSTTEGAGQHYVGDDGVSYDANNNRLFVGDAYNSRVLVYNVAPSVIANGENASYVIGWNNFSSGGGYNTTQSGLYYPSLIFYDPGSSRLFVGDTDNNRIVIFDGSTFQWTPGYD
jgi:DNA-binding beta-propeller fold protein YncE